MTGELLLAAPGLAWFLVVLITWAISGDRDDRDPLTRHEFNTATEPEPAELSNARNLS